MMHQNFRPLVAAGTVLGIGMGGFVDGILLHQIFQVHNMLSNTRFPDTLANAEINMFWDGVFHAFTWISTLIGLVMLWNAMGRRNVPRSSRALVGSMVMGWGIFNLTEGIIDHHILQIHHVIQRAPQPAQLYWDLAFLAFGGGLLITLGWLNIRKAQLDFTRSKHSTLTGRAA